MSISSAISHNRTNATYRTDSQCWHIGLLRCFFLGLVTQVGLSMQITYAQTRNPTLSPDARVQVIEQGAGPLVVVIATANRAAEFERIAAALALADFQVLLLRSQNAAAQPASALTLDEFAGHVTTIIERANKGPAVIVAESGNTEIARRVALDHPDYVRGLSLAGEVVSEPAAAARANDKVPAAATLYLIGARATNRAAAQQAQSEWGSRLTLVEIADAGQAPLTEQPQRAGDAIVNWLRGSALSANDPQARIGAPEDAALTVEQKRLRQQMLDSLESPAGRRVGALGPRAVLLHDPKLLQGYTAMGDVMATAPLPLRYKELAIIVTARAMDSDYEWAAHERAALNAGVPAAVVAAIKLDRTPAFEHAADRIVYNYANELHRNHKVSDATYKQAWDLVGTNGLINLTTVIGHYVNVAMTLNAHQLALPADAQPLPPRERR